jgi:hypothetical protein
MIKDEPVQMRSTVEVTDKSTHSCACSRISKSNDLTEYELEPQHVNEHEHGHKKYTAKIRGHGHVRYIYMFTFHVYVHDPINKHEYVY